MYQIVKKVWNGFLSDHSQAGQLFSAIEQHDQQKLLALIVLNRALIEQSNARGNTPLMDAVIGKNYDAMRLLIQHGAKINRKDCDGWTAYSWAVFVQDREAQKILAKAGRTVAVCDSEDISGAAFGMMASGAV